MNLGEFEKQVETVIEPGALWKLVTDYFDDDVVPRVAYHHLPPPGAPHAQAFRFFADGYPEQLVVRYVAERLYRDNPLLVHGQQTPEPFYWSDVLANAELDAGEQAFIEAMRAADFGEGIGIQVFGPNGRNGYFGLGLAAGVERVDSSVMHDFHWVCQLAHLRYCALLVPTLGAQPILSPRESEVLVWVARGKSNAAIASILGISAHTVDAHLRRIYLKLGVSDRVSAAVRGLGVGLIRSIP
jgi:LuxR family transcriptional regulator/LuxR family quorum-sensing system transcriptional regulator CciR